MGYIHAGTNGKDFRTNNEKRRDELKKNIEDAKRHLLYAERSLACFDLAQERAREVKYELGVSEPSSEELDKFLSMRREDASYYIDETHPDWPQKYDQFDGDLFLRLIRNK